MAQVSFSPPFTQPADVASQLRHSGFAVLSPAAVAQWAGCAAEQLAALVPSWDNMPDDAYLKDGGRYRKRRHSCYVVSNGAVQTVPHRAHWQPLRADIG